MNTISTFWKTDDSPLMLNPRMPLSARESLGREVQKIGLKATLWLQSSGTESSFYGTKLVAISKSAFLAGAQACVDFYALNSSDIWLNVLPLFHVGGLAIEARCFLVGAKSVRYEDDWSAQQFHKRLLQSAATWSSLVPTQVYDLVEAGLYSPPSLRGVLVGGGALSKDLLLKAKRLGWPLLPSYGMTETSAIVAGAPFESIQSEQYQPGFEILPHVRFEPAEKEKFIIHSPSLFSGYLLVSKSRQIEWRPRPDPFLLDDKLVMKKNKLYVLGRDSQLVKIMGETVNLQELTHQLESLISAPLALVATPQERKGFDLHLFIQAAHQPVLSLDEINAHLLPFQRVKQIYILNALPRTELGKIKTAELLRILEDKQAGSSK